jgi:hypothetical protein
VPEPAGAAPADVGVGGHEPRVPAHHLHDQVTDVDLGHHLLAALPQRAQRVRRGDRLERGGAQPTVRALGAHVENEMEKDRGLAPTDVIVRISEVDNDMKILGRVLAVIVAWLVAGSIYSAVSETTIAGALLSLLPFALIMAAITVFGEWRRRAGR